MMASTPATTCGWPRTNSSRTSRRSSCLRSSARASGETRILQRRPHARHVDRLRAGRGVQRQKRIPAVLLPDQRIEAGAEGCAPAYPPRRPAAPAVPSPHRRERAEGRHRSTPNRRWPAAGSSAIAPHRAGCRGAPSGPPGSAGSSPDCRSRRSPRPCTKGVSAAAARSARSSVESRVGPETITRSRTSAAPRSARSPASKFCSCREMGLNAASSRFHSLSPMRQQHGEGRRRQRHGECRDDPATNPPQRPQQSGNAAAQGRDIMNHEAVRQQRRQHEARHHGRRRQSADGVHAELGEPGKTRGQERRETAHRRQHPQPDGGPPGSPPVLRRRLVAPRRFDWTKK